MHTSMSTKHRYVLGLSIPQPNPPCTYFGSNLQCAIRCLQAMMLGCQAPVVAASNFTRTQFQQREGKGRLRQAGKRLSCSIV
mmetsp:Transcript_16111/g.43929  ORF Transcript_16111/g.43929 Transcript_16111/m.43929 type:complete len:82 (-) Transcript_16111:2346-2591(-)